MDRVVTAKNFILKATDIKPLAEGFGGCIASDMITVHGHLVGTMYREEPQDPLDSGWRFTAGLETEEYMDELDNLSIYDVNTIANYDPDIIPFLNAPVGSAFERDEETKTFLEIDLDLDL